jgi:glycosyltransferase involved in cell wall biosynthesis
VRVTFLTHYYPPEVGAPQTRISALASGLAARGVEVAVHAPPPHYPDGRIPPGHRNRLFEVESDGPVRVVRSAVLPAPNRGFARRLANHASFGASAVAAAGRPPAADVVVVESPPLFTAGAAVAYARRKGAPLVLNIADMWPDSAIELGALRSDAAIRAARSLERRVYRRSAAIVCPTEGIEARLGARPDAAGKVTRIPPAVDVAAFEAAYPPGGEGFRVLYAGTTGMAQGMGTLLEAAAALQGDGVEVTIAGDGAEGGTVRARAAALPNVSALGTVPHDEVPRLLAGSDAAVVLLRDKPLFEGALPTKLLEAMAAGRPVVLSARGESARLLSSSGGGVVVPPEDPAALAAALRDLASDRDRASRIGEAGRAFVSERHSRAGFVESWLALLERAAGPVAP